MEICSQMLPGPAESQEIALFKQFVKAEILDRRMRQDQAKGATRLRLLLLTLVLSASTACFASTSTLHSSLVPEPGTLALLGGGLMGLASLVRRLFGR